MKAFKVSGTFLMGRDMQPFTKEVAAENKDEAKELVYSIMGSKHGVKRFRIEIKDIKPLKPEEVTDPVITHKIGADK